MAKILNQSDFFYFSIPMEDIPFAEFPIDIKFNYAYCRFFNVATLADEPGGFNLIGVYDYFSNEPLKNIDELVTHDFLFGQVVSFDPPLRGRGSYKLLEKRSINLTKEELPHFKIGKGARFYVKDGNYHVFSGIKTEPENLEHLEVSFLYGEDSIRLRMIIELIKREAKKLNRKISRREWEDVTKAVWGVSYGKKPVSEEEKQGAVDDLLDTLLDRVDYQELPREIRERARNEITKQ